MDKDMNPGIVKTVKYLQEKGFYTCDSGDGETHKYECDRPYGYVTMLVKPEELVSESHRLKAVLEKAGLKPAVQGYDTPPEGECNIQSMYCPVDGIALIDVMHVHDRMLKIAED